MSSYAAGPSKVSQQKQNTFKLLRNATTETKASKLLYKVNYSEVRVWVKSSTVTNQMKAKANEQYFPMALFT